jgi:hypothetical protein
MLGRGWYEVRSKIWSLMVVVVGKSPGENGEESEGVQAMLAGAGCAVRLVRLRMEVAGGPCAGGIGGF